MRSYLPPFGFGHSALLFAVLLAPLAARAADPIKLNSVLVSGGDVLNIQFSPDSTRLVYRADQDTDNQLELFSAPVDGLSPAVQLNGTLNLLGDANFSMDLFSSDSSRVLYVADQVQDGVNELYTVPADGSGSEVKINGLLGATQDVVGSPQFSPDSARITYLADQDSDGVQELYSAPSDGSSAAVKLNTAMAQDEAGVVEGELIPIPTPLIEGDVEVFQYLPDSSRIIYLADQDSGDVTTNLFFDVGVTQIYSVPADGSGAPVRLNADFTNRTTETVEFDGDDVDVDTILGDVTAFEVTGDSSRVVYRADAEVDGVFELYSAPSDGSSGAVKLNPTLTAGGSVSESFQVSGDSSRVLYIADQLDDGILELYTAPTDGSATAVRINGPLQLPDGDVVSAQFTPDSGRVVYLADETTEGVSELYSAPSDGSGSSVKISGAMTAGGDVQSLYSVSPDSSRVLYLADQETDGVLELFSVATDGSIGPVKLNGDLTTDGDVAMSGFSFSPDSSRVIYVADQETNGVSELYIVPSDGGEAVKLNGEFITGGSLSFTVAPLFSPDGSRVAYVADQDTDGMNEVFVRIVKNRAAMSGDWDSASTWEQGVVPDEVMQVVVDSDVTVTASGSLISRDVNELTVLGDAAQTTLDLSSGAVISAVNDVTIGADGVVSGAGLLDVGGDLSLLDDSLLIAQLGGLTPGDDFVQFDVAGDATLDGLLRIETAGGFTPTVGQSFEILSVDGLISGTLALDSVVDLGPGVSLDVVYSADAVTITVTGTGGGLAGDYNNDGMVDAADYAVWRNSLGQTGSGLAADGDESGTIDSGDYLVWRNNYGASSGAGASAAVPEPASAAMLLMAVLATTRRRRA